MTTGDKGDAFEVVSENTDDEPAYIVVNGDESWVANYGRMEGELTWEGEDLSNVTTDNSSLANEETSFSSQDLSIVTASMDYDGIECKPSEDTLAKVMGDKMENDTWPGAMLEHFQAEINLRFADSRDA